MRAITGWRADHPAEFAKLGLRYGVDGPPADVASSPWFPTLCPREADVLIAACKRREQLAKHGRIAVAADVSQAMHRYRLAVNSEDKLYASTPSMITWLFDVGGEGVPENRKRNRLMIGQEALSTHCIPWENHVMAGVQAILSSGCQCLLARTGMTAGAGVPHHLNDITAWGGYACASPKSLKRLSFNFEG